MNLLPSLPDMLHGLLPSPLKFTFEQPYWLLALILVPFIVSMASGWLRRAALWRRTSAMLLRTLVLTLLILAQARPTFWDPDEHLTVALVVDRSESMRDRKSTRLNP